MKKVFLIMTLALISVCTIFAQSISEGSVVTESLTYDVEVNLTTGLSSNDLVSSSINKDGNLELTYKGTSPITISLTGKIDGTLIVKSDNAPYTLIFDNITITGNTLPAIQLKSETEGTIYLPSKSVSYISDSRDNSKKGAITTSGNVVIKGDGTLNLEVFKKHGLKLDGGLTIESGNVNIHGNVNAEGNMISADLWFIMNGGNLTINAEGNVHATESKGIKVNGVEGKGTGLGFVEINDGNINIVSVGKAITAGWKIDEDATTEDTGDDPTPNVYINGGNINILTTGIPYEYSDDESLSPEGIEAKDYLYVNGGYIYAVTTDDTYNAGKGIIINGGYSYLRSSDNDSFDSNGIIEINGGTVITMSSSWEQAFDCDNDMYFSYTGG
ncbi:MAG: carbohydrate-binding domain-containing protein, partial [Sphaerochaetaceae bacterium]|nr:carbohydrate-binding domain-containing protein [Sphaerochaetaceae bacterium]